MKGYLLTPAAESDLIEIIDYVARDSLARARHLKRRFLSAMSLLAREPELGHTREDLCPGEGLRFWPVRSYVIVYRASTKPLQVIRVLSGYRDIARLL